MLNPEKTLTHEVIAVLNEATKPLSVEWKLNHEDIETITLLAALSAAPSKEAPENPIVLPKATADVIMQAFDQAGIAVWGMKDADSCAQIPAKKLEKIACLSSTSFAVGRGVLSLCFDPDERMDLIQRKEILCSAVNNACASHERQTAPAPEETKAAQTTPVDPLLVKAAFSDVLKKAGLEWRLSVEPQNGTQIKILAHDDSQSLNLVRKSDFIVASTLLALHGILSYPSEFFQPKNIALVGNFDIYGPSCTQPKALVRPFLCYDIEDSQKVYSRLAKLYSTLNTGFVAKAG